MEVINIVVDDRTQPIDTQSFQRVLVLDTTKQVSYQEADQVSAFVGINPTDESYNRIVQILGQNRQSVALYGFEATADNIAEHMEELNLTRFMHINIADESKDIFKAVSIWGSANEKFVNYTPPIPDGITVLNDAEAIDQAELLAMEINNANSIILMHRGTIDQYEKSRATINGSFTAGDDIEEIPDLYVMTTTNADRENYAQQTLIFKAPASNERQAELMLDGDIEALPIKKVVLSQAVELEIGDLEVDKRYILKSVAEGNTFYWVIVEEYTPAKQYDLASGYIGQFAPLAVGSTTAAFKQVMGAPVNYYSKPNQAKIEATNRLNWIQPVVGIPVTMDGRTTMKTYFDHEVGKVWLKIKLNEALAGLLVRTNRYSKIPFTLPGKSVIDTTIRGVIGEAEQQGFLVPNSSVVFVPNPDTIPTNDKGERKWTGIRVISTVQGAVHGLNITYVLEL